MLIEWISMCLNYSTLQKQLIANIFKVFLTSVNNIFFKKSLPRFDFIQKVGETFPDPTSRVKFSKFFFLAYQDFGVSCLKC